MESMKRFVVSYFKKNDDNSNKLITSEEIRAVNRAEADIKAKVNKPDGTDSYMVKDITSSY